MDFFARQEKARRNTAWLVVYFVLGVALMLVTVNIVFAFAFRYHQFEKLGPPGLWNPSLCAWVSVSTLALILGGSLFKTIELAQGGSIVAGSLGGEPVDPHTRDPDFRKLLNVVEEMSIAAGVPRPELYVMRDEKGINAFAAGTAPDNAVIGVTEGCVRYLSRDELQGVIAHEFSHILNGDMRLNLRLMGIIFGIVCVMLLGRVLLEVFLRGGSDRGGKKGSSFHLIIIAVALLVIGWLGAFFGKLIQAAVSRQREFLADASAVQFTRNPLGLAGALKKIGGFAYGSKLASPQAAAASHMFFGNGVGESWFGFTATHPPLEQRIRLLDPAWDGKFPTLLTDAAQERSEYMEQLKAPSGHRPAAAPQPLRGLLGLQAAAGLAARPLTAAEAIRKFDAPTAQHLEYAAQFKAGLSPALVAACEEPLGATALIFGLLLSGDPAVRASQLVSLNRLLPGPVANEVRRLDTEVAALDPSFKLSLAMMALPGLRRMAASQYLLFEKAIADLVQADQQIDLFEFALQKIVLRRLEPQFKPPRKNATQYYALSRLLPECAILLSSLAHVGHQSPAEIQNAFRLGASQIPEGENLALMPLAQCGLADIDAALDKLNQASLPMKKIVLTGCAHVVAADGTIQWREAELLRAIADALDCPVPPFIAGV
ncbi:MAG: hypothetical protein QOF48_582 [Verrucomicrobiota bacterium]|jgi:Zn-dependent protease with chaperone function